MTSDTSAENEFAHGGSVPSSKKKATPLFGTWTVVALTAFFVALFMYFAFSVGFLGTPGEGAVSPTVCGEKALQYINANLVQPGTSATLVSSLANGSIYAITTQYQSQTLIVYATSDCNLLFPSAINMSAPTVSSVQQQQPPRKSSRPTVDLYVMSFCPYGTQAEEWIGPVVDLLGSQADFRIRYITTISGSTTDSVQSLHGSGEAQEDLQQICINRNYPAHFWEYVKLFDQQCYPSWQNATALSECRQNVIASLNMDPANITTCSTGQEGLALLKTDETDANANGATASPTLLINGVEYTGARTPEAYKEAICNSFDTEPPECNTTLPAPAATNSGGGCG